MLVLSRDGESGVRASIYHEPTVPILSEMGRLQHPGAQRDRP